MRCVLVCLLLSFKFYCGLVVTGVLPGLVRRMVAELCVNIHTAVPVSNSFGVANSGLCLLFKKSVLVESGFIVIGTRTSHGIENSHFVQFVFRSFF